MIEQSARHDAMMNGLHSYVDTDGYCPDCHKYSPSRHVDCGGCMNCLIESYKTAPRIVGETMTPKPCHQRYHLISTTHGKRGCITCKKHQSPRQLALRNGETWYTPDTPCLHCNTTSLKRVYDGRCQGCIQTKSTTPVNVPRIEARRVGHKYYTPSTPCSKCGLQARRDTHRNQCRSCHRPADYRDDTAIMDTAPDLVITRDDAEAVGYKVYRTGKACSQGHTGFRWVVSGICCDC